MAYQSFYNITDWQNLPAQKTALNRTNLLHLENGKVNPFVKTLFLKK